MPITTGRSGRSAAGTTFIFAPPGVANIPQGATVTYGQWQTFPAGTVIPTSATILEFESGSGELSANNQVIWRTVTIT